jgi:hypothetical protein
VQFEIQTAPLPPSGTDLIQRSERIPSGVIAL